MKNPHQRPSRPQRDAKGGVRSGNPADPDASPSTLRTVPPWIQRPDLWIQNTGKDARNSRPKFLGMSAPERLAWARFLKSL